MAKSAMSSDALLEEAIRLLRCLVARDMARTGITQEAIAKFFRIAKADVVPMVRGIKRPKASE